MANLTGSKLYPLQENEPVEKGWKFDRPLSDTFPEMSPTMGLLQMRTGERPVLRGDKEGVGLYAGGGGKDPVYSRETDAPIYIKSAPPPPSPSSEKSSLAPPPGADGEWVRANFKKREDLYAKALKAKARIIQIGREENASPKLIESILKERNLHNFKEPTLYKWEEEIIKEEKKTSTEDDTAFQGWIGKLNILRTKEEPNQSMIEEVENYIKTKFPKSWESFSPTPPPHIPTSIAEWSEGRRDIGSEAKGQSLDTATAMQFLQEAGGNAEKARERAKQEGYSF